MISEEIKKQFEEYFKSLNRADLAHEISLLSVDMNEHSYNRHFKGDDSKLAYEIRDIASGIYNERFGLSRYDKIIMYHNRKNISKILKPY